ncbi:MAG: DedA family protein [Actinomycetota bacterium]|nr:DedA family protein [Actinomycetota bacterium]
MSHLVDSILHLSPVWILAAVALLVFAEDAIFVGFVIPGESAAVVAGVAAALGRVPLWVAIVVVVAAAIIGDTVGYEVGRHVLGPKVLHREWLGKHRERIEGAQDVLRRRGGIAVFLGRFTAFFRAMMPALAGSARMRYRKFLFWNALGGVIWGTAFVVLGYVAGSSYHVIEAKVGKGVAIGLAVVVVLALVGWRVRKHRQA